MGRKAKPFNDAHSKKGLLIMEKLKNFCSETECGECVFADDNDGSCYFASSRVPESYNKEEVIKLATYIMNDEEE